MSGNLCCEWPIIFVPLQHVQHFFFFLGGEKNANYDALIRASNRCGGVQLTWWGYKFDLSARDTQVRGGGVGGGDGGRLDGGGG